MSVYSTNQVPLDIERILPGIQTPLTQTKQHFSKFHVTWSSNIGPRLSYAQKLTLADDMDYVLNDVTKNHPQDFFKFNLTGHKIPAREYEIGTGWSPDLIQKYRVRFVVEEGTHRKGRRIHAHILFYLEHTTILLIDKKQLMDLLCDKLRIANSAVGGCYMSVKWIPVDAPLERYIGKNPFGGDGLGTLNPSNNQTLSVLQAPGYYHKKKRTYNTFSG